MQPLVRLHREPTVREMTSARAYDRAEINYAAQAACHGMKSTCGMYPVPYP